MEHVAWSCAVLLVWVSLASAIVLLGRLLDNELIGCVGMVMAMLACCVDSF